MQLMTTLEDVHRSVDASSYYAVKDVGALNFALSQTTTPGGLRIDDIFEPDIEDAFRRRTELGQRMTSKPVNNVPHRWIEKDALPGGQAWVDPQLLTGQTAGTPSRSAHYLEIKALMGEYDSTMYNREVTEAQGVFSGQDDEDFNNTLEALILKRDKNYWTGLATSINVAPNNAVAATLEFCSFFRQLVSAGNTFGASVTAGTSIIRAIMTAVANIMAQDDQIFAPTAIYIHPLAHLFLTIELEDRTTYWGEPVQAIPGKTVSTIMTAAGPLPLITDNFMGTQQIAAPGDSYPIVITCEKYLENRYLTEDKPRIFELGLVAGLARKRVMVMFAGFGVKRAALAHAVIKVATNWTPPV